MLKAFLDYNIFIKYQGTLKESFIEDQSREVGKLFKTCSLFHKNHPEKGLSVNDLELYFSINYPAEGPKTKEIYASIFEKLAAIEVNKDLIGEYIEDHIRRVAAAELSLVAIDCADGKRPFSDLEILVAGLGSNRTLDGTDEEFVTDDLEAI